ncbi:hypothetical protein BGS_0527 [Beggiatoa sp. SS]|nr:hypothetical protein BGS_0527 [Beggiatoa sp. SS]
MAHDYSVTLVTTIPKNIIPKKKGHYQFAPNNQGKSGPTAK